MYTFSITIVSIITGYLIKSYFYHPVFETPNEPPVFNLTRDQLREIEAQSEKTITDFIKSGKNCYPKKYPMISADEPRIFNLSNKQLLHDKLDRWEALDQDILVENAEQFNHDIQPLENDWTQELLDIINEIFH